MYYFFKKQIIYRCGLLLFLLIAGCAQLSVRDGIFSPSHKKYSVTLPVKGWEVIKINKEDLALWNEQSHATIAFISSEIQGKESSLEMLRSRLFIGMKNKRILLNESALVDSQRAIHTVLVCEIDNHIFKVESYVIKFGNKVYDLISWAPPDLFDCVGEDFKSIVQSFKFMNL